MTIHPKDYEPNIEARLDYDQITAEMEIKLKRPVEQNNMYIINKSSNLYNIMTK